MLIIFLVAIVQTVTLIAAAFLAASIFSIGFGDARTAILKFAAASIFSGAIGALIPLFGILEGVIFLLLIVWLFDIELFWAIMLAVLDWLITLIAGAIIIEALRAALR